VRPSIHLTAPVHWINDPVGLIQLDGRYHVFSQQNRHAPAWGRMEWGHASSADLAHWVHHPPALEPGDEPGAPDHDGCWSGTIAIVDGRPTAFYTGVTGVDEAHRQSVCVARSSGPLLDWAKDPRNPIVGGEPRPGRLHQRDPFVFRHGGRWIMLLGTGCTGDADGRPGSDAGRAAGGAVVVLDSYV
jgi:beta-fructofuranosidase